MCTIRDTADVTNLNLGISDKQEEENEQTASPKKGQIDDATPTIYYGEETEQELVNWEEIFFKHLAETRLLEKKREEQIEKSWALLRECKDFLRENDKKWKLETELPMMKRKVEEKKRPKIYGVYFNKAILAQAPGPPSKLK